MLVIFDCDGVLVDSERLAAEVFAQQLAAEGVALTAAECLSKFKGLTLSACIHVIEREFQRPLAEDFLNNLKCATRTRFARELQPVTGVVAALDWLNRRGVAKCVASNGGVEKIRHSLAVTGLDHYFPHLFSADQVARGKPEPDLFLLAAQILVREPMQCIVVEDSITGVRAALSAGMLPLLYTAGDMDAAVSSSTIAGVPTFKSMQQLPDLLASFGC